MKRTRIGRSSSAPGQLFGKVIAIYKDLELIGAKRQFHEVGDLSGSHVADSAADRSSIRIGQSSRSGQLSSISRRAVIDDPDLKIIRRRRCGKTMIQLLQMACR